MRNYQLKMASPFVFLLLAAVGASAAWSDRDVGVTGLNGRYSSSQGTYEVRGSGGDIWGEADGFHFVYVPWNGDGQIVARVASVQNADPWAKAGVMIRASLAIDSPHAMVALTPGNGVTFLRRTQAGGATRNDAHQAMRVLNLEGTLTFQQRGDTSSDGAKDSVVAAAAPYWFKLVRRGIVFAAYASSDGV